MPSQKGDEAFLFVCENNANILSGLSRRYYLVGDLEKAFDWSGKALKLREKIVAEFPTLQSAKRKLAESQCEFSEICLGKRDRLLESERKEEAKKFDSKAQELHKRAFAIRQAIWLQNPKNVRSQEQYAISLRETATFDLGSKRFKLATKKLSLSIQILRKLVQASPADVSNKLQLSSSLRNMAVVQFQLDNKKKAIELLDEAVVLGEFVCANKSSAKYVWHFHCR